MKFIYLQTPLILHDATIYRRFLKFIKYTYNLANIKLPQPNIHNIQFNIYSWHTSNTWHHHKMLNMSTNIKIMQLNKLQTSHDMK